MNINNYTADQIPNTLPSTEYTKYCSGTIFPNICHLLSIFTEWNSGNAAEGNLHHTVPIPQHFLFCTFIFVFLVITLHKQNASCFIMITPWFFDPMLSLLSLLSSHVVSLTLRTDKKTRGDAGSWWSSHCSLLGCIDKPHSFSLYLFLCHRLQILTTCKQKAV